MKPPLRIWQWICIVTLVVGWTGCSEGESDVPAMKAAPIVDSDEILPRIPGYVLSERISALVDAHIQRTRQWEHEVYHLEYMAHRDDLVFVYVRHQDESRLAGENTLGSVLDFYIGIDEQSGEIRKEGKLQ